jgi:hypothetical protein
MNSLAMDAIVGLITQPILNLRGSNVHDTQTTESKYRNHHGSRESNTWAHFEELPKESFLDDNS